MENNINQAPATEGMAQAPVAAQNTEVPSVDNPIDAAAAINAHLDSPQVPSTPTLGEVKESISQETDLAAAYQALKAQGYIKDDMPAPEFRTPVDPYAADPQTQQNVQEQIEQNVPTDINTETNDNVDNNADNGDSERGLTLEDIDELLDKSKNNTIFEDKQEEGELPPDATPNPDLDKIQEEKQQLEKQVESFDEEREKWYQEKSNYEVEKNELQRRLDTLEVMNNQMKSKLQGYETNPNLVAIGDPGVRMLSESVEQWKKSPSPEKTIEILNTIDSVVKTTTGGLGIEDVIQEYQSAFEKTSTPPLANTYSYSQATSMAAKQKQQPNENDLDATLQAAIDRRS